MNRSSRATRRRFLQSTVGAIAAAQVTRSIARGRVRPAPSRRITLGFIGLGWKGFTGCWGSLLQGFIADSSCQVLAVCDVDRQYLERAKGLVDQTYGDSGCKMYRDFRDLIARPDIDAMVIATPDHWHAVQTIWACRHGKDVYCEKPLSLTIREARAMVAAARRYGRVVQTGSQSRSMGRMKFACDVVRSGRIGKVLEVHVGCGGPSVPCPLPGQPVPKHLDWDLWLGPAPWRPYHPQIHPVAFRAWSDYSGGGMTDWGAHHFDLAQWALGKDDTGPAEIIPPDGDHRHLTYQYADGVRMMHTSLDIGQGVTIIGTEGKVWMVGVAAMTRFEPASLGRARIRLNEMAFQENDAGNKSHTQDFLECVRTRRRPNADVAIGCRTVAVCLLGNIAYQLKRPLKWDPAHEVFVDDEEANRLLDRARREPWDI